MICLECGRRDNDCVCTEKPMNYHEIEERDEGHCFDCGEYNSECRCDKIYSNWD